MTTMSKKARMYRIRAQKAVATRSRRMAIRNTISGTDPMSEEEFTKLPAATQRVMLALDVLSWIRSGAVKPTAGRYVAFRGEKKQQQVYNQVNDAQANSEEGKKCFLDGSCHVCAKGSLMVAHVMRANNCTIDELASSDDSYGIASRLSDDYQVFDHKQLDALEVAFEKTTNMCQDNYEMYTYEDQDGNDLDTPIPTQDGTFFEACISFGKKYNKVSNRLAAVMINLAEHGGTFVPTDIVSPEKIEKVLKNHKWGTAFALA